VAACQQARGLRSRQGFGTVSYVVGVDSGVSHTNIRMILSDGKEKVIPEIDVGLTSNQPDDELAPAVVKIFAAIGSYVRTNPAFIWVSATGFSASTRQRFVRLLESNVSHLGGRVGICNDAVSIMLAHDAELVIIVAGAGSVAMARRQSGDVIVRGGDEWVVADAGSAFWIGIQGIRAAYQAMEGGPDTALVNGIIEHYRRLRWNSPKQDNRTLISEIARNLAGMGASTKPAIASFAGQVTHQAEVGDDVALAIVRQAAEDLASAAVKVYRELAGRAHPRIVPPRFLLSGGVGFHSRFYAEAFKTSLNQLLFPVREDLHQDVTLKIQLNGTAEALELASRLAKGTELPTLDQNYAYALLDR
jgi:N-acetylglucosamine kinase-like BadF-type ATPase